MPDKTETYRPFPELELQSLAAYHDAVAGNMQSSYAKGMQTDRAAVCREAIKCQDALRDRCHLAELNLRHAEAILAEAGIAFQRVEAEVSDAA